MKQYEVRDLSLAPSGPRKIQWVKDNMPLLRGLEEEFSKTRPFEGIKISLSVHLEAKTAYLCLVLAAGGAQMSVTGSNILSTQDDVAAALVHDGLNVFAYLQHLLLYIPDTDWQNHPEELDDLMPWSPEVQEQCK